MKYLDPGAVFAAAAPFVPAELIGHPRLVRCEHIARSLPLATVSYYLECRLAQDDQVDFLTMVRHPRAAERFRQSLALQAPCPAWERTLDLLDQWCAPDSSIRQVPFIWLEYDMDANASRDAPAASPGFCVEPSYLSRFDFSPLTDTAQTWRLTETCLRHLLAEKDWRRHEAALRESVLNLPQGGALIHVSAMLTREPQVLKLYVALPKASVLPYLSRIGWNGSVAALERLMRTDLGCVEGTVFLDLCLNGTVHDRLGVAFSQFYSNERSPLDPAWGWIAMEDDASVKRKALGSWPGTTEVELGKTRAWLRRWVDIKAVIDHGAVQHKAYLGFMASLPPPFA